MSRFIVLLFLCFLTAPLLPTSANEDGKSDDVDLVVPPDAALPIPAEERGQVRDWYIVTLRDTAPDPGTIATDLAVADGLMISHVYRFALEGFAAKIPPAAVEALRRHPHIRSIAPVQRYRLAGQTVPEGVHRIEAAPAFKNELADIDGDGGAVDVDVAVIDSGIDKDHPDLNYAGGFDCTGLGGVGTDQWGHGSLVAGIIGAKDNDKAVVGVAPGARVWSIRVLDVEGQFATDPTLLCAIDHVTAHADRYEVANMSLGTNPIASGTDDGQCGDRNPNLSVHLLHRAICDSVAEGVTYVVAAMNDCRDASQVAPASFDEVITVSAMVDTDGQFAGLGIDGEIDPNDEAWEDCLSTLPSTIDDDAFAPFSNFGADVDLAAPGVDIVSTYKDHGSGEGDGTSFAAPHVAGAAALYLAANPGTAPADVLDALLDDREEGALPGDSQDTFDEGIVNVNDDAPWPDDTFPTGPTLSLTETSQAGNDPDQHVSGTTLFYNNSNGRQGAFKVTAVTQDVDSGIDRVEFPALFGDNGGTDTSNPYEASYNWDDTSSVSEDRTVSAFNGEDMHVNADFTVIPDHSNPTSSITSPAADATVTNGQVIQVSATDPPGGGETVSAGVAQVEVRWCQGGQCDFGDGTTIGVDTSAPYEVTWSNQPADGTYYLIARTTDNVDNKTTSAKVRVFVDNTPGGLSAGDGGGPEAGDQEPDPSLPAAVGPDGPSVVTAAAPYRIARSGVGNEAGGGGRAHDGRPGTEWATDDPAARAVVWFDLGEARPIAAIRWMQGRPGPVEVQVSNDRKTWTAVGRDGAVAAGEWQPLAVTVEARYVRFIFVAEEGNQRLGHLAEVEVYGPPAVETDAVESAKAAPSEPTAGAVDRDDRRRRRR